MKSLKKLMMICELEKKNWRQQLQRLLRAYRAAPHRSTGFAPATLLFNGRQYRTRLPSQKPGTNAYHAQVKLNDDHAKEIMRQDANSKSYVKESDIAVGDQVLIKQTEKGAKTIPPYQAEPYTVVARNGSQIKARKGQLVVERHVNHCKKLRTEEPEMEDEVIKGDNSEAVEAAMSNTNDLAEEEREGRDREQNLSTNNETLNNGNYPVQGRSLRPRDTLQRPTRYEDSYGTR